MEFLRLILNLVEGSLGRNESAKAGMGSGSTTRLLGLIPPTQLGWIFQRMGPGFLQKDSVMGRDVPQGQERDPEAPSEVSP